MGPLFFLYRAGFEIAHARTKETNAIEPLTAHRTTTPTTSETELAVGAGKTGSVVPPSHSPTATCQRSGPVAPGLDPAAQQVTKPSQAENECLGWRKRVASPDPGENGKLDVPGGTGGGAEKCRYHESWSKASAVGEVNVYRSSPHASPGSGNAPNRWSPEIWRVESL